MVIALAAVCPFGAEGQGMRLPGRIRANPLGPFPQATQALGKCAFPWGVIRLPHTSLDLRKDLAQGFRGPVTDLEKGMEKTQDDRDGGAPCLPSALGGGPPVCVHGMRGVRRFYGLRFLGKDAVSSWPVWGRGGL